MSQSISVRREGNLIVIEDIEDDSVLKATYLDLDAALRLFRGGQALVYSPSQDACQTVVAQPLATASDPYPEDVR